MKTNNLYIFLFLLMSLTNSCDKPYNYDIYSEEYNPINTTFYVGDKESGEYFDFEPDISYNLSKNPADSLVIIDSIDLNADGIFDHYLLRIGRIETDNELSIQDCGFNIMHRGYYNSIYEDIFYGDYTDHIHHYTVYSEINGQTNTLSHGDILYDVLNWGLNDDLLIGTIKNQYYESKGLWRWNHDEYLAFISGRNNDEEYVYLGWLRMEFNTQTATLTIKDRCIKQIENPYKHYYRY
ncbi:MAG: hypothetical protein PF517_22020 [Salinivirgaceae bacterium]|jgi:hypothetical protein|nr:hypothetical protein [Salinivirgaceae bacterium]